MSSEAREVFRETISQRLASVLNLPYPLQDEVAGLTVEQHEILKRTDRSGNTQLMIAAEHRERGSIEFLIRHGSDVNYFNKKTHKKAIDIAWEQGCYECMLLLLQANSDFPETYDSEVILNDDAAPEELKVIVTENDHLHQWIMEGDVKNIHHVISKWRHSRFGNGVGQTAIETAARYGNVNVLASLLELQIPIPPGKISLPEDNVRLLSVTNALGDSPLLLAARGGRDDNVDLLLRCGANVGFRNTLDETAIDIAWVNCHYKVVLVLLEADSVFPHEFSLGSLMSGNGVEELKEFVGRRSKLHEFIRSGGLREVKNIISENAKQSSKYLNIQGQSALYTAINEKKYDIYAFLKSIGVYFKDEQEEVCLESLKIDEKFELKTSMIQYFPKIPDSHILYLVSKSKSSRPYDDFKNTVYNFYKVLDEIPHISKMLEVIQYADYVEIVFDFDRQDISHVEPRHSSSTRGVTDYKSGRLYVGFKMDTPEQEAQCLGTLAHELTHLAMQITFQNECNPYGKHDTFEKSHFVNEIVSEVKEYCRNTEHVSEIINRVFTDYRDPDDWPAELIVRVPQILAQYGEDEGIDIISTHTPQLLSYFTGNIVPKCEEFVQQNFLIKPRNMVRTLNQYLGNLNELEKANIHFKDIPYQTEFFDSMERNILLINTSNTWLSCIHFHQALQKISVYSLPHSYLILQLNDFENFQEDIIDAFSSDVVNLMVVECYNDVATKILSKVFKDVARVFRQSKNKKLVLIVHNDNVAEVKKTLGKERLAPKLSEHSDADFSLGDLSNESQNRLRDRKVTFEGISISLKSIVNEGTAHIVDSETLVKLIRNKEVVLGNKLDNLGEIKDYYIARSFNINKQISQAILKDETITDLFFISGSNLNLVNKYHNVQVCTEDNRETEEHMFFNLCDNYPHKNIHYFRLENEQLTWIRTKGSISSLRRFRQSESSINYSESDIVEENKDPGPIIISDTAGMGKTTVLANLALEMKHKYPSSWVFRIDLNNYNHELETELNKKRKSFNSTNLELALNFFIDEILKVQTQFEKNLIKENFKKEGNVVMLFDGFDEISPLYTDIILNLIQALKNSTIKKIFVTCRPYVAEQLEETFGVFSFGIEPFSNESKKQFLVKFWKKRFNLNEFENQNGSEGDKLELIAQALIDKLSVSINDRQRSFTGIPLQLRMLAEVFPEGSGVKEGFEKLSLSSCCITLPEISNLVDLYERFVNKKYDIYKIEKVKAATAIAAIDIEEGRQTFIKNHQKIAVYTLLPNVHYTILLSDEDIYFLESFIDKIIEGKEKTGIIDGVIKIMAVRKPHFIHLTFAEYFTASFLSFKRGGKTHSIEMRKFMLTNIFVSSTYVVVRHFLNGYMQKFAIADDVLGAYGATMHDMWFSDPGSICTKFGQTVLHIAVTEDNESIVDFFVSSLDKKHDTLLKLINAEDRNGRQALHSAAENGNLKIVQLLVEHGADVNVKDNDDRTVLFYAARHNIRLLEYLVRHGADTKSVNMLKLYMHSKEDNQIETFKWLVENGGDVNIADKYGETLMHCAAQQGDLEIIKWLIDKGKVDTFAFDGDGRTLMHTAAGSSEWEVVKWLVLHDKVDVNSKDINGYTVLHYAAHKGNKDVVTWLLESKDLGGAGANINIIDNHGRNVLYDAVSSGNLELMKWLVALHVQDGGLADINITDNEGNTVLHEAASFGQLGMLEWLVRPKETGGGGADISVMDKTGQTVLDVAAYFGQLEIVQLLISKITDTDVVEKTCKKILHKAASFGELRLVEWLLQNARADINYRDESGRCLLHYAAKHNNYKVVKWLLESGAGVNIVDKDGKTALHEAAGTGIQDIEEWMDKREIFIKSIDGELHDFKKFTIEVTPYQNHFVPFLRDKGYQVEGKGFGVFVFLVEAVATLKMLLERGADISIVDKHGRTPLYYATFLEKPGVVGWDIIKLLVSPVEDSGGGADIHVEDDTGRTLMHKVAEDGEFHLMKWLLETNADFRKLVNVADTNGFTPLHYATVSYTPHVIGLLAAYGADVNAVNKYKRTPLHEAANNDYFEALVALVKLMVHHGDDKGLNAADVDGFTALHYTALKGNLQSVRYLAQRGADPNIKDSHGRTPLHLAAKNGKLKIVKYLVEINVSDLQDNDGKTALDLAYSDGYEEITRVLKNADFVTGNSEHTSSSVANLVELQQHLKVIELQPTESSSSSECSSLLRMKRDLNKCSFKEQDYFPYIPQEETVFSDQARYSKMYPNICMVTVFNNAKEFSKGDTSQDINYILTYSKYIGDIMNKRKINISSREKGILADHSAQANTFFKLYPPGQLLIESSKDPEFMDNNHQSWIFDNGECTVTIFKNIDHYEMYSQDFNYKEMFRMKDYLTFAQLQDFLKSFFKWRSGKTDYRVLTLTSNLPSGLIEDIHQAAFWHNEKVIPDDVILIKDRHNLIENIQNDLVLELFLVKGKSPEFAELESHFFENNKCISVRLEKLLSAIPYLRTEQNEAITKVIKKYNIPFEYAHTNSLHKGEAELLDLYKTKLRNKLKAVHTVTTDILSDVSWDTLAEELRNQESITEDITRDVVNTAKAFHKSASAVATMKGMATQTLFFLPDIIRSTNYGDFKNLAQTTAILGGDAAVNTIYEHFLKHFTSVIPAGRAKLLNKLPVTSPIFKALCIYSIVQLHKQLQNVQQNSDEHSILKHKLGEQYVTAGLIAAEMLGCEVTPLWIALIAEQLIFDAASFRKTHHLDIPFWESFIMSLGFEQDKLQNIFEERELVEMNLAVANRRSYESRIPYGWTIVRLPKLANIEWHNTDKDTIPTDIRDVIWNSKNEFSSTTSPQQITSVDGFRLVQTYKLRSMLIYGNIVITRGKMISSVWQKAVYKIQRADTDMSFSCLLKHCNRSFETNNYFLARGSGNNTNWQSVASIHGGREPIATTMTVPQYARKKEEEIALLEINCSVLSALYINNETYAEDGQRNIYLAFDPREGNLTMNTTASGLHQLNSFSTGNTKGANYSTHLDISSNQSPYIITIEVGPKGYPNSIQFPNQTGEFTLNANTKKIISQYVITDNMDYVIKDTTFATRISFTGSSMHAGKNVTCNTVNGAFNNVAVKSWTCSISNNMPYKENSHIDHSATIMLSANKRYLQFYLGSYVVDECLELSATHVDVLEARGKLANYSKISMSTNVHSFDVGVRSNIVITDDYSEFRAVGEFLTKTTNVHYKKSAHNRYVPFYEITVEDLWEVTKTVSRSNLTLDGAMPIDIRFHSSQVQLQWQSKVPTVSILHVTGSFDGMTAVLQIQQNSDKITISNGSIIIELTVHYKKSAILENMLILQSVLTPSELGLNMNSHDYLYKGITNVGELIRMLCSVFCEGGSILVFKATDGHPVYHVIPAGGQIQINNTEYTVSNGIICVQSAERTVLDGQQLINSSSSSKVSPAQEIIGVCTDKSLTDSDIFLKGHNLVINNVEIKNINDNTKIYFKGMQTYTLRVLKDTFKYNDAVDSDHYSQIRNNTFVTSSEDQKPKYPVRKANASSESHTMEWTTDGLSVEETQATESQTEDPPSRDMPKRRHRTKRLSRLRRTSHSIASSGAARTVSFPLAGIISWLEYGLRWMSSSALVNTNKGFLSEDPGLIHTTTERPADFINCPEFHLNGTLSLLDLAVRKFTKVKPFLFKETPLRLLWLQGEVLNIVTAFEDILDQIDKDKLSEKLVFDPVDLQNGLLREVNQGNYKNVKNILYDSIINKNVVKAGFDNILEEKINNLLKNKLSWKS